MSHPSFGVLAIYLPTVIDFVGKDSPTLSFCCFAEMMRSEKGQDQIPHQCHQLPLKVNLFEIKSYVRV